MRCSLLKLTDQKRNDFRYKTPLEVINSGINPIVYASKEIYNKNAKGSSSKGVAI